MPTTGGTDETRLRGYALRLADAIDAALPHWVVRSVERFTASPAVLDEARAAGRAAQVEVGGAVRALLLEDIDDQTDTEYLVTTLHVTVKSWKGIGTSQNWGILPDDLLAAAARVHVGSVDHIDADLDSPVEQPGRLALINFAAELHRA